MRSISTHQTCFPSYWNRVLWTWFLSNSQLSLTQCSIIEPLSLHSLHHASSLTQSRSLFTHSTSLNWNINKPKDPEKKMKELEENLRWSLCRLGSNAAASLSLCYRHLGFCLWFLHGLGLLSSWVYSSKLLLKLDFNLTEKEFVRLEFDALKLSLLHSRC